MLNLKQNHNTKMLVLTTVLFSLFLFYGNEVKAQCPAGYNQKFVTVMVGICEYEVQVCYKCVGYDPIGKVNVFSFRKVDLNCPTSLNTSQVFESICTQVYEYNFIKTFICANQLAPCEPYDGGITYDFFREMCWMKKLLADGTILYWTCNFTNTYCHEAWKMCYDPTLPPDFIRYTLIEPSHISGRYEERCQGMIEPDDPTLPEVWSTCFELHTPCNP